MFELVFVRDPKVKTRLHSSWYAFPDQDEYPTKDLYIKHPTREGLWKHVARTDDVIVLSNGEKVVSIPIEDALHEASEIQAVVVLGHGRFQVAALVEPTQEARKQMSEKELMKKIMPYIRKANGLVPGHARLTADHVLFTDPERPMIRTPKGTVVRKATLALYKNDVDKLYTEGTQDDSSGELSGIKLFEGEDIKKTEKSLHDIIAHVTEAKDIEADQDLFAAGVDSLQVLSLVKLLKAKVKAEMPAVEVDKAVTPALVYASPTVKELAKALIALSDPESGKNQEQAHHRAMEEMLDKYSQGIPTAGEEVVVLLTGSTGSLGCYLLDELVSRDRISRVYALNRADDGLAKQTEASGSRGLSTDFRDKVVFLHADLARERLGLDAADYAAMQTAVTFVIHNAWPVNFNQTLPSFEPHVRGTRHLIDFSAAAVHRPPILFTSTMATAQNWRAVHPGDRVPERLIGDMRVPAPMGYAESKYVAEHLLAGAANLGVSAAICHVGQVAGPVGKPGVWNKQEWFPSVRFSPFPSHDTIVMLTAPADRRQLQISEPHPLLARRAADRRLGPCRPDGVDHPRALQVRPLGTADPRRRRLDARAQPRQPDRCSVALRHARAAAPLPRCQGRGVRRVARGAEEERGGCGCGPRGESRHQAVGFLRGLAWGRRGEVGDARDGEEEPDDEGDERGGRGVGGAVDGAVGFVKRCGRACSG